MSPQDRYNSEEIAQMLDVKVATLYDHRWREQSKCPLFKVGKKLFAWKNEFDEWYQEKMQYV